MNIEEGQINPADGLCNDVAEEQPRLTGKVRKRTPSTIKHIFVVIPKDGYTYDTIDYDVLFERLLSFLWSTSRKKDNPPRFKVISNRVISVEFLKARRIDYDNLEFDNVILEKKPFKMLYESLDYLSLTIDKILKK
jgi:hypothetical protein